VVSSASTLAPGRKVIGDASCENTFGNGSSGLSEDARAWRLNAMYGIHLLGEWYGCPADEPLLTQADALRDLCRRAVEDAGLTIVGDRFFQFEPQGVTGTVLLAESHLAIHTWPESGFVTVDVYVCNYTTDNTGKAERVFRALEAALKPQRKRFQAIHRGGQPMLEDAARNEHLHVAAG
jgi:S-adenosylmethionine decarboxylase